MVLRKVLYIGIPLAVLVTAAAIYVRMQPRIITTNSVTFADKNKLVEMEKGQTLIVRLDSTYWQINEPKNPSVITKIGKTGYIADKNAQIPGTGAGIATAQFTATSPGTSEITATRNTCGEAMGCTQDMGNFSVAVRVK